MIIQPKFPVKAIPSDMPANAITERIIKSAIKVQRQLGPGLLESVYEEALDIECNLKSLQVLRQFAVQCNIETKPLESTGRICWSMIW